ncbi:hypothetical protein ABBQ32_008638 [Trebouxia sp. C0010 RCD-2024]
MRSLENTLQGNRGLGLKSQLMTLTGVCHRERPQQGCGQEVVRQWKFVVHMKLAERCGKWAPPDIVMLKRFQALLKRSRLARLMQMWQTLWDFTTQWICG